MKASKNTLKTYQVTFQDFNPCGRTIETLLLAMSIKDCIKDARTYIKGMSALGFELVKVELIKV